MSLGWPLSPLCPTPLSYGALSLALDLVADGTDRGEVVVVMRSTSGHVHHVVGSHGRPTAHVAGVPVTLEDAALGRLPVAWLDVAHGFGGNGEPPSSDTSASGPASLMRTIVGSPPHSPHMVIRPQRGHVQDVRPWPADAGSSRVP